MSEYPNQKSSIVRNRFGLGDDYLRRTVYVIPKNMGGSYIFLQRSIYHLSPYPIGYIIANRNILASYKIITELIDNGSGGAIEKHYETHDFRKASVDGPYPLGSLPASNRNQALFGLIKTEKVYKKTDLEYVVINKKDYKYDLLNEKILRSYIISCLDQSVLVSGKSTNVSVAQYMNYIQTYKLSSVKDSTFTHKGIITNNVEYKYNDTPYFSLSKETRSIDKNKNVKIDYTYPYDFASGNNVYQQMVTKNMISPVVEQTTTHNDKEIGKIKTEYTSDANKTKGLILPGYVQTSSNGDSRTDVTYDRYDTKGNILQYTTFDGVATTYLWSNKGQYPVAEIKNATYEEVTNALTGTTPEAISALSEPDMTKINALRNTLPHALVTTYTYKPLVGMTSMTDPAGVKTIYTYDDFGRLKETLIEEGGKQNPVNTYQYHYRTSSEP